MGICCKCPFWIPTKIWSPRHGRFWNGTFTTVITYNTSSRQMTTCTSMSEMLMTWQPLTTGKISWLASWFATTPQIGLLHVCKYMCVCVCSCHIRIIRNDRCRDWHIINTNAKETYRNKSSKWYMPESLYPRGIYPPFLSGTAYLMSR